MTATPDPSRDPSLDPDADPAAGSASGPAPVLDAQDLRAAVAAGIVSEAQATRLSALGESRRGLRAYLAGDEPFELFRGFNDVFVALGVGILGLGLASLSLIVGAQTGAIMGAAGSWLLAEYLTRRRRMTLPSLLLAFGFAGSAMMIAASILVPGLMGDTPMGIEETLRWMAVTFGVGAGAALLFHMRFRLPFALFVTAVMLYAGLICAVWPGEAEVIGLLVGGGGGVAQLFDLGESSIFAIATLVFGLVCFAAALAFDLRDPHRVSRLSACGFWLHLAAGPAIVNTVALTLLSDPGPASALWLGLFLLLLAFLALALDRRSLLLAASGYLASILWSASAAAALGTASTLLVLGALVVALGAGWITLRGALMRVLPDFPGKDRLPPWTPPRIR